VNIAGVPRGSWRLTGFIVLETRVGRDVPNAQQYVVSTFETNTWAGLKNQYHGPEFRYRTDVNPIYNCHGLTFASRRTWIADAAMVRTIVGDDCYVAVGENDAMPGDIVVYVAEDGDVEHSGVVVREKIGLELPLICSKWGKGGEVIHPVHKTPYSKNYDYFRVTS
jgi:hypothetical protein